VPEATEVPSAVAADGTSVASGTCARAARNSVASGCASALEGSVASGDSLAIDGSVASGCSVAIAGSVASGCSPAPAAPGTPAPATRAQTLNQSITPGRLALTGTNTGSLVQHATLLVLLGGILFAAGTHRRPTTRFVPSQGFSLRRTAPEVPQGTRQGLQRGALALQRRSNTAKVQVSGPKTGPESPSVAAEAVLNHTGRMGGQTSVRREQGARRYSGAVSAGPAPRAFPQDL